MAQFLETDWRESSLNARDDDAPLPPPLLLLPPALLPPWDADLVFMVVTARTVPDLTK